MTTNFFSQVAPLLQSGLDLTVTMRMKDDKMVVAVRPQNTRINDKALDMVKPLILEHPVQDLDKDFFETIASPVKTFEDTAVRIKSFEDSVKEAEKNSQAKKKADAGKTKQQKDQEKKNEQAKQQVSQAAELFGQEKFKEALTRYKKAKSLNPNHEGIDKFIADTEARLIAPILQKADQFEKANLFKECPKFIKQAKQISPDHPDIKAIEDRLKKKIGDDIYDQLMSNPKL